MITFLVVFLSSVCRLLNIKLAIIVSITFFCFYLHPTLYIYYILIINMNEFKLTLSIVAVSVYA